MPPKHRSDAPSPSKKVGVIIENSVKVILVSVSVLLSLVICEQVVRYFRLAPDVFLLGSQRHETCYQQSADTILGYELTPNCRGTNAWNQWGSFSYVNRDGLRDIERSIERRSNQKRLLFVGDSVVAGHGVAEIDDLISRKLESLYEGTVEVLALGVGGYNAVAVAELLRTRGPKYRPDGVIYVCVENDHWNTSDLSVRSETSRPSFVEDRFLFADLFRVVSLRLNLFGFRSSME